MAVGSSMKTPMASAMARTTEIAMVAFQAFSLPSFFSSHTSVLSGSYSSGTYFSRTSAEYIMVLVPVIRDTMKETTPLTRGTLDHFPRERVGWVFMWMRPSGRRTAMAVFSGPRIMIPSIMACPPMEVGQASFKKILLKSINLRIPF